MSDEIGKVIAIVSNDHLLIEVALHLEEGERLTVFERISELPTQLISTGLEKIDVPKGTVEVVSEQSPSVYLAKRFQLREVRTRVVHPKRTFIDPLSAFFGSGQEVTENVMTGWSASLDARHALRKDFSLEIRTGDLLARVEA